MKKIWTKEKCIEEALKYLTKNDFCKGYPSAYINSLKNKWIDDITKHMIEIKKPKNYWTKEKCIEEALKYKHRGEFSIKSTSAYTKACENGWLDDICSHMNKIGSLYKRCIYSYEFDDNSVYIGLTLNIEKRNKQHLKKGPVFNHIIKTSLTPRFIKLTDYIYINDAINYEYEYTILYKNNGWFLLNRTKTGALGSCKSKWTKEKCHEEALKYTNVKDYKINSTSSYRASIRNKWLNDICLHMNKNKKPAKYWTKEKCHEEALKYINKKEFSINCPSGYSASRKNNWLNEICSHMKIRKIKQKGYWTKEKCHEEALKFKTKGDFQKNSKSSYQISARNNWLNEICLHM